MDGKRVNTQGMRVDPEKAVIHVDGMRVVFLGDLGHRLREAKVEVDWRNDRLRIGFGIYQDAADVDALLERLSALAAAV